MENKKHIIAIFEDPTRANEAINKLLPLGITPSEISLMVSEGGRGHHFSFSDDKSKTAEGIGYGAVLGGLVGGLAAIAIPGSIFIAGPLAALLASSGSGAAVGGLAGGLIGMGIPADEVNLVERDIGNGNILVAVHSIDSEKADLVRSSLKHCGAKRLH